MTAWEASGVAAWELAWERWEFRQRLGLEPTAAELGELTWWSLLGVWAGCPCLWEPGLIPAEED